MTNLITLVSLDASGVVQTNPDVAKVLLSADAALHLAKGDMGILLGSFVADIVCCLAKQAGVHPQEIANNSTLKLIYQDFVREHVRGAH